ncbi:MAG: cbb3-type cytochrome oxidase assembly protein [Syntrophobacteraceae bacterium]|jgi:cbb3-type cytochrome oxidase maturation protein|nr:cbb3-type cytochrome oxidase assembly protein [Syntrophobacteraceae bacterium]
MYFPYFIAYMTAGFVVSLVVFIWALRSGQFRDQQRARYLPLEEDAHSGGPGRVSRMNRLEAYALAGLACSGLLASGAVLIFSLLRVP